MKWWSGVELGRRLLFFIPFPANIVGGGAMVNRFKRSMKGITERTSLNWLFSVSCIVLTLSYINHMKGDTSIMR